MLDESHVPLGFYAACIRSYLSTFRSSVSVPSSKVKQFKQNFTFKMASTVRINVFIFAILFNDVTKVI